MLGIVSIGCGQKWKKGFAKVYPFGMIDPESAVIDLQSNKVYQGIKQVSAWVDKHEKTMSKQNKIPTSLVGIDAIDWLAKHDYVVQKIEVFIDGVPTYQQGTIILTPSRQSIIASRLIPRGKVVFSTDNEGIIEECALNCLDLIHTDDCIIQINAIGHDIRVTFYVEQR